MGTEPGRAPAGRSPRYEAPAPADGWTVGLTIDGTDHDVVVDVRESLWETMTYRLGLTGSNLGCDRAQCGICNVVVDGRAVNSCSVLTARLAGRQIQTVAGLHAGDGVAGLHPLQRAFWEEGAFQCGICTKGFLMTSYALLEANPEPSDQDIRTALAGVLCRCGEGARIVGAVQRAAAEMRQGAAGPAPAAADEPGAQPPGGSRAARSLIPHRSDVLGTSVPRIHGFGSVTEEGNYVSLVTLPEWPSSGLCARHIPGPGWSA